MATLPEGGSLQAWCFWRCTLIIEGEQLFFIFIFRGYLEDLAGSEISFTRDLLGEKQKVMDMVTG